MRSGEGHSTRRKLAETIKDAAFWLIAGPNGGGKSTLAQSDAFAPLAVPKPLNPDVIALELLQAAGYSGFIDAPARMQRDCSIQAANWVYSQVEKELRDNRPIGVETVLSTDKYLSLFQSAAARGGAHLIYIGNQSPEISIERVAIRVRKGGHDVPGDKIRARWHRSLEFLPIFWQIANEAWLYDHSDSLKPPELIVCKLADTHLYDSPPKSDNALWRALVG